MKIEGQSGGYRHSDIILSQNGNNLWLGDIVAAEDKQDLKKKNIRTVITCMQDSRIKYEDNIRHFHFPLKDIKSENISQYFTKCSRYIKEGLKIGSVLVHCGAGVSRSTTFAIAYLMKEKDMSFHESLKLCKLKRPQVCPNLGFQMQLKFYQKCLKSDNSIEKQFANRQFYEVFIEYFIWTKTNEKSKFGVEEEYSSGVESWLQDHLKRVQRLRLL